MIATKNIRSIFVLFALIYNCRLTAQDYNPGYTIGTITGKYNFSYNQTPDQLVELRSPGIISVAFTYQWQSCSKPDPLESEWVTVSTANSYTFSQPLQQTTYFRCRAQGLGATGVAISNTIKINVVSTGWEDINYIRQHDVMTTGMTDWKTIDQLPTGQKLQSTSYLDGLGRSVESVAKEMATPSTSNGAWGDIVSFAQYDALGRQSVKHLPYTTNTEAGKYKTAPLTEQPQYYLNTYNETAAFSSLTFDNSPLSRVKNVKEPGTAWSASAGNSANYDINTSDENVQIFQVDYVQGNPPINKGAYNEKTLYKLAYTDVNGKKVIEYSDVSGKLILKKIQLSDAPSVAHAGWICTYSIYDDFGLLRYQIQPEGVNYLDTHGWSFAGTDGQTVLNEQCFQYNYDDKGRTIWKKAPGAAPLKMLYDSRDRVVFMQDGNQAALSTPQWTTNLYDELDRPVITALYNTKKAIAALQTDINKAISTTVNTTASGNAIADLTINNRNPAITTYAASNSISFTDGFISGTTDEFIAQIAPGAAEPDVTITTIVLNNPISQANLSNAAVTTILKYLFYDSYTFTRAKAFDNSFTNANAYSNSDPNVISIAASKRTTGMPTGSLTRVLGTNMFLAATNYFDEKGRPIQSLEDNIKSGVDISTMQYHFDGRLLSTCMSHSAPGTGYAGFVTLNKYLFDKLGRVVSIQKKIGGNWPKTILKFDYDDIGRVKTKHLDPDYINPESGKPDLESLNYNFNIHNQITGINKDYALKGSNYDKWGHFFGMYLGYDNKDGAFAQPQLNGQVGGILWNTQGDDAQRKYDYTYDNAGRLINAAFNQQQHPGDGWGNSKLDFSVSGISGKITYDLNGNLLTMLQKGVAPGTATPVIIDDLHYTYNKFSNKLQSVTDQMTIANINGISGDFKDGVNGNTPDYVYDANGNLVIDLNKNAKDLNNMAGTNGIHYNFLDKPDQIRIAGKGTIKIVYDANGDKLQRVFIPETGSPSTITTYIDGYVYQETNTLTLTSTAPFAGPNPSLAYINFEEGRIRVMQSNFQSNGFDVLIEDADLGLPNNKKGAWDFFIRDYQQNVRMILTEAINQASSIATMETSRAAIEDLVFGQTGAANEVEATRYPTPPGWKVGNNTGNAYVSRLGNLSGHTVGPNTLQKVMAGDKIYAGVQYYFENATGGNNPNIVGNILSSLAQAITGGSAASGIIHNNAAGITSQLNATPGFVNAVKPAGSGGTTPQAYLTILFFDERFNLIDAADGGVLQQQVASSANDINLKLLLYNVKAPKNGYMYVYVSNLSDPHVYFDNFAVSVVAGNIIEENHYYAYGLKIAGISSRKLGDTNEGAIKNNYLYNDKELFDDGDLNWLDYGFRNYDPQIGRFPQLDPLTDEYPFLTPYQYASCDPITNIDIDGLEGCPSVGGLSGYVGTAVRVGSDGSQIFMGAQGFIRIAGTASNIANTSSSVINTNSQQHVVSQQSAGTNINGNNTTSAVGTITTGATVAEKAARVEEGGAIIDGVFGVNTALKILKPGALFLTFMFSALDAGTPMPKHPRPGYVWVGDLWKPITSTGPLQKFSPAPNIKPISLETPIKEEDDEDDLFLYRGGSFTDVNFTPKEDDALPGSKQGWSTFTDPLNATLGKGGRYQVLSITKLKILGFGLNVDGNHVGIVPKSQAALKAWAATKEPLKAGKRAAHLLTKILKKARIREGKL